MANITNELIYEILKNLQQGQADLKAGQQEMKAELHGVRGHMLAFQTDIHNLYSSVSGLDARLERVERRLNLRDERQ